jgi:peptidyl-prolyl cis-trans isomerase C
MERFRCCTAYLLICLPLVCFLLAKSAYPKDLVKFDDTVITDSDVAKRIELLPQQNKARINREKMLNRMIDEDLITREAQRLNLHDTEDYKLKVETFKRELLMELYLKQYLEGKNTQENQKKFYEENKQKYSTPELVRISMIRTKSEEEAKDIVKRARAGEDFAELARKYSKGPAADKGGDYGYRARQALRKEIADVAFSMKPGDISDPIKTPEGYQIVKVTEHRKAGIATFEEAKARVASEYAKKLLDEKISELRKSAKIQFYPDAIRDLKIEREKGGEK